MKLPSKQRETEGIIHVIYPDYITILTNTGSDGEMQEKLKRPYTQCINVHKRVGSNGRRRNWNYF